MSAGTPQGVASVPNFSHCNSTQDNNIIIKYADDTTILGLIKGEDESSYRDLVHKIIVYGENNDLVLNIDKTKKLIMDFRGEHPLCSLSSSRGLRWSGLSAIRFSAFTFQRT